MSRIYDRISGQVECSDKCVLQFWKEVKRTAKECNISLDRLTTCKTGYSLVDDRLEYGCCKVWLCSSLIDKRLNVSFGKYTTSCGDRVYGIIILCIVVESCCVGLQKCSHLIYERTGTSGADTVHSLFDSVCKIYDLGILTTKLYCNVGLWSVVLKCL